MKRCSWAKNESMHDYHDKEWGVPIHNDKKLFEFLILESFQAGLSWAIVLKKRENFRKAFANFNPKKISEFGDEKEKELLNDAGIIRNRLKISAAINNAKRFLKIKKDFGSFDKYIWSFVNHKPIQNNFKDIKKIPAKTEISDKMSKDMGERGFKFRGSTICYAFMQAVGMVNDHEVDCFRYKSLK